MSIKRTLDFGGNSDLKALYDSVKHAGALSTYYHMNYLGGSKWEDIVIAPLDSNSISTSHMNGLATYHVVQWTDILDLHKYFGSGDYVGTSVQRSNREVFLKKYGELEGVYEVYGDYSYNSLAIRLDKITPEMVEDFEGLEEYPVLDDEHHSNLEMEMEVDDWQCYGEREFKDRLRKFSDAMDDAMDSIEDGLLLELYFENKERTNSEWINESGTGGCIQIERIVKDFDCAAFLATFDERNQKAKEDREAREAKKQEVENE